MDLLCDELILKIGEHLDLGDIDNLSHIRQFEHICNMLNEEKRFTPKNREELKNVIDLYDKNEEYAKKKYGDPNEWNVSNVTDMRYMFYNSEFNRDISKWNVGNVTNMSCMFYESEFNSDISKWNVSNVTNMSDMFSNSKFNGDISKWNVSNVTDMNSMFCNNNQFNGDISKWNVSNVTDMNYMFCNSKFNWDISKWTNKPEMTPLLVLHFSKEKFI